MSPLVIALALSAAVLHAGWNAFLRGGSDRLLTVTVMAIASAVLALPWVLLNPLPPGPAWSFILLSTGLQVLYVFFLVAAYRLGELGQIYPVVRGSVPLLVTLGGVLFRQQVPPPAQILGIALVGAGIISLALGRGRAPGRALLWAFGCSLIIATYSVVDSEGVARTGDGTLYAAWVLLLFAPAQVLAFLVWRGRLRIALRARETWMAALGGVVSMASYGAVVTAYAFAAAGPVTALRETSVVFAVLIGWLFLGEGLSARRLVACLIVAAGAVLIGM